MNKEKIEKTLAEFVKNPYWRSIYDNAPEKAKQFYRIRFAYAEKAISSVERNEEILELYKEFTPEDWDYVISNCENKMSAWGLEQAKAKYQATKD